jgi:hypothetical protein
MKSLGASLSLDLNHWRTSERDTEAGLDFGDGYAACHGISELGFGAAMTDYQIQQLREDKGKKASK